MEVTLIQDAYKLLALYRRQRLTGRTFYKRMNALITFAQGSGLTDTAETLVSILSIA